MKKSILILLAIVFTAIISSCDNATTVGQSKLVTVDALNQEPGFAWFNGEVSLYQPKDSVVTNIKTLFNPSTDKFYIFVKPSCGCVGTTKRFPHFYKVMKNAGIPDSNLVIYAMSTPNDINPLVSSSLILKELPSFFRVKNGVPVYSLLDIDTMKNRLSTPTIEELVQESLKK